MTSSKKSHELEKHFCAYNDGKQSCKCFLAGFDAAQEEQITIMEEQTETNERYLEETKKRDERIVDLEKRSNVWKQRYDQKQKLYNRLIKFMIFW